MGAELCPCYVGDSSSRTGISWGVCSVISKIGVCLTNVHALLYPSQTEEPLMTPPDLQSWIYPKTPPQYRGPELHPMELA